MKRGFVLVELCDSEKDMGDSGLKDDKHSEAPNDESGPVQVDVAVSKKILDAGLPPRLADRLSHGR